MFYIKLIEANIIYAEFFYLFFISSFILTKEHNTIRYIKN